MPTFKSEIQNKRKDGTYNVRIRVTHNKEVRRISTNLFATSDDLTRGLKIKNQRIIDISNELIKKCRDACNNMGSEILSMPIAVLIERLKFVLQGGNTFRLDFIKYAETKIQGLSKGTAMIYGSALNLLRRFIARDELDISEINASFLRGFEKFIESEPSRRGNNRKKVTGKEEEKKGARAVSLYLSCIRALYNQAKEEFNDEDRGIINIPYSPFVHFKIKAQPRTRKRAISVEMIQSIIDLPYRPELPGKWSAYNLAKDCFLLSFMFIGINSADMYYALPPKDGVLIYNRKKTATRRDDKAEMRVRVEYCATELINKYRGTDKYFNFSSHYSSCKTFNKIINEGLKEIGKEIGVEGLTFYAARHSWATIARSAAVGIDKATVHEALNHVDKEMRITDIYIDKDWTVIWDANKKVLDLFDWSELELLYIG